VIPFGVLVRLNTVTMLETDSQLIRKARAGDRLAGERLSERYRGLALATACRALGNFDDAQDVAQEALVYALLRLPDLRDTERFPAWLRQLTLSLCADYRRRRGTRRLGEPIAPLNEAAREEADFAERFAIRQAVASLSDAHRTTLLLHYAGGWSLEEVAALTEAPVNTVRSRLRAAKRLLRADLLHALFPNAETTTTMPAAAATTPPEFALSTAHLSLLNATFPDARVLSARNSPEPWMPFSPRVRLALEGGAEKEVDFRGDVDPGSAALLPVLERVGLPAPRLLSGPTPDGRGKYLCLCEPPRGENLLLWTLGGTPHRIRLATERAFEGIDRLHAATDALRADPLGAALPERTLTDQAEGIVAAGGPWLSDPWFLASLARVREAAADVRDPLVYTDYLHYFPNFLRILPGPDPVDGPLGWPGDARMKVNPIAEYVSPFGHYGDPLLGLAMVWVYDCYPFVHTGFVEQYLWRRGLTRRDFAPRLALQSLRVLQRELPTERPAEGAGYWDSLHGYVDQALGWM